MDNPRPADEPSPAASDDLVILIHGTYAAREADEGADWWQTGSETWKQLQRRLPQGVRLSRRGEVFHWSGENSERARIKASKLLLTRLHELEAAGQHYHLIGHSHGGSLIWQALKLATLERKPLPHLRSWATVGTPFLHHRTRGALNLVNLVNIVLAVLLFKPACATLLRVLQAYSGILPGLGDGSQEVTTISFYRTPVLWVGKMLGMSVTTMQGGVRIGSFDSSRGDSFTQFLLCTPEGWLLLGIALLVIYVYLNLSGLLLGPVIESLRIRAEKRLEREALQIFRGRWLGLWSPDDEAINGLRATLELSVSFVARMVPHERVLCSDYLALLARPYYWVLAPIFNSLVRPLLDRLVRSLVVKTAQGNNRPAAEVIAVSPAPVYSAHPDPYPPLPPGLNQRIVETANQHARDIAPKLRKLLAEPSFVSGLESFGDTISGRELVHTSYFDHPEILDLLVLHIAWAKGHNARSVRSWSGDEQLVSWLREFKRQVGVTMNLDPPTPRRVDAPQAKPILPRRRSPASARMRV